MGKRIDKIRSLISNVIAPIKNKLTLPEQFLRFGNRNKMGPGWSEVVMSDRDLYTGYGYAAIRNRANMTSQIAINNVLTKSEKEGFVHPYLDLISNSKTFSKNTFWSDISTYLDLEGIYYLMAIRAVEDKVVADEEDSAKTTKIKRVGNVIEFKLLNPYNISRVITSDEKGVRVKGYIEAKNGFVREIPREMIIEMKELNPFNPDTPYALTDAAKESQFTLKTAGDYTRNALKHNINAPGIMATDVILEEEQFKNFTDRVRNHTKGEPIFGNGHGAITWNNMQVQLSKSALKEVNDVSREALFAVTGMSKTMLGIEQSGVTRNTSDTQRELTVQNHILPRTQLIVDAMNQDFVTYYPKESEEGKFSMVVNNPLGIDHEAEKSKIEVKDEQYDLFAKMVDRGVSPEDAAGYIEGEVELETIELEPKDKAVLDENKLKSVDNAADNESDDARAGIIRSQQGALQNEILNLDTTMVAGMIVRLNKRKKKKNQTEIEIKEMGELITKTEQKRYIKDLALVLGTFYAIIATFKGPETMSTRMGTYASDGLVGIFKLNAEVKANIKALSLRVAESHIMTISDDIFGVARKAALEGKSLLEIERIIKEQYTGVIADTRAKTIARTETNRAFTLAQYEADRQFIEQNELEGQVFKQWRTRSDDPCPFCLALEAEGPVPFGANFRDLGGSITADGKELAVSFEPLKAGNAHPNCGCEYELIIKTESENALEKREKIVKEEVEKVNEEVDKLLEAL